jgi:assimilatory nitrate reductase electron transfer subunit
MRTSDSNVFAVGDVADHGGRRYGLWPASVEQAQVAVRNMLGDETAYHLVTPPTRLKVPGIDLLAMGAVDMPHDGDSHAVVVSELGARRYRKLILRDGRLTGAIVLGSPELFDAVTQAVEARLELGSDLDALEHGNWEALSRAVEAATPAG